MPVFYYQQITQTSIQKVLIEPQTSSLAGTEADLAEEVAYTDLGTDTCSFFMDPIAVAAV